MKDKKQLLISYKKIFNENINFKNIHKLLTNYEKNKDWDKMYQAFKDACKSKPFLKISKKLESLSKKFFKEKFLIMDLGDVCIFHEHIIHRSNKNKTNKIRFAGINRQQVL